MGASLLAVAKYIYYITFAYLFVTFCQESDSQSPVFLFLFSCRKLENTRACKDPKDVFDFRWAEIPLVTSQQRWRNQNGGRSELSEVISQVKMRLYRKRIKDL